MTNQDDEIPGSDPDDPGYGADATLKAEEPDVDYGSDVETLDDATGPTDDKLRRAVELARLQFSRQKRVDFFTKELAKATAELEEITQRWFPALLIDIGLGHLPLVGPDGRPRGAVDLKTKTVASVREEDRPVAYEWLHKIGSGDIVKRSVETRFGRGDANKANKLRGYLKRWYKDFVVVDKEAVHAGTLNAWAKEFVARQKTAMEEGGKVIELPDAIKITDLRTTVITLAKGVEDL